MLGWGRDLQMQPAQHSGKMQIAWLQPLQTLLQTYRTGSCRAVVAACCLALTASTQEPWTRCRKVVQLTTRRSCSYLSTPASSSKPGHAVGLRPVHHQSPRAPVSSASAAARSKSDCPRFKAGTMFRLGLRVAMFGSPAAAVGWNPC